VAEGEAGARAGEAGVAAGGAVVVERGGGGGGVARGGEGDEVADAAGFEGAGGLEGVEFEEDAAGMVVSCGCGGGMSQER
jgi:hypothetical protein